MYLDILNRQADITLLFEYICNYLHYVGSCKFQVLFVMSIYIKITAFLVQNIKLKRMQRLGTEAIRTQIPPSKPKTHYYMIRENPIS